MTVSLGLELSLVSVEHVQPSSLANAVTTLQRLTTSDRGRTSIAQQDLCL